MFFSQERRILETLCCSRTSPLARATTDTPFSMPGTQQTPRKKEIVDDVSCYALGIGGSRPRRSPRQNRSCHERGACKNAMQPLNTAATGPRCFCYKRALPMMMAVVGRKIPHKSRHIVLDYTAAVVGAASQARQGAPVCRSYKTCQCCALPLLKGSRAAWSSNSVLPPLLGLPETARILYILRPSPDVVSEVPGYGNKGAFESGKSHCCRNTSAMQKSAVKQESDTSRMCSVALIQK